MRCLFCHNPDTWQREGGMQKNAEELLDQFERNREFYIRGGITASGGEPLLQLDFLLELFEKAKSRGISTCLDTSGICFRQEDPRYQRLAEVCDLVLLDIKQIDPERHRHLTGHSVFPVLRFAEFLDRRQVPLGIRHVYVNESLNPPESLQELGRFLGRLRHIKSLEVLPYHTMGISKYEQLGINYPLKGVPAASKKEAQDARRQILMAIQEERKKTF